MNYSITDCLIIYNKSIYYPFLILSQSEVYCVRHFVLLGIICKKVIPSTQYTQ